MRTLLYLLVTLLFAFTLGSCQQMPATSNTRSDSTVIIRESVPVFMKGGQASKALNVDSLRKLYSSGVMERFYTVTEKNGNAELKQRIDLLTGQLQAMCTARDTVYIVQNNSVEKYRSESKTVQLPAENPSPWQQFKKWLNTNLQLALLFTVIGICLSMFIKGGRL